MENTFDSKKERERSYNKLLTRPLTVEEVSHLMTDVLADMNWLEELVKARIAEIENPEKPKLSFTHFLPPSAQFEASAYQQLIKSHQLSSAERLLLICALMPYIAPERLTHCLREENNHVKLKYPEFGGYIERAFMHFVPSLQTILFLLAGADKTNAAFYRMAILKQGKLIQEGIITLTNLSMVGNDENNLQNIPVVKQEFLDYFLSGVKPRPDYGRAFPATWVTTGMDWEHLVLNQRTREEVEEIMRWVEHGSTMEKSSSMFNTSYPCLFYGPPGTGKSLTAKLIGKKYNKDVFKVDLSMVVSKYVGETEKNLAYLFDRAQGKDWILFFDEADSLFSKRTEVGNANDKWANLEVSYLLQRMEEHKGLTILATNMKDNLDNAMIRRFQAMIYFAQPGEKEREQLWQTLLPKPFTYGADVPQSQLSKLQLSGANIANIIKDACLTAVSQNTRELKTEWLNKSIRKEFVKEKRTP